MPAREHSAEHRARRVSLGAIVVHMAFVGLVLGISLPLTTVLLESRGVETWLTGVIAGIPAAAIVTLMPVLPRIAARLGTLPSIALGIGVGAAAILLQPLFPDAGAWAVLRYIMGAGLALPWLVGEIWINRVALAESRARVIALYAIALFGGFALGPLLLGQVGTAGWTPFLLAAGAALASLAPVLLARRFAPPMPPRTAMGLGHAILAAPTVLLAAFVAGALENAAYAMLPVFGLRSQLPQSLALQLLTALLVGGMVLQYPLGWLADRFDRNLMLGVITAASALIALALPAALATTPLLFTLAVCFGALTLAVYTVALAILGERFPADEIAAANAAFIFLYELGSFAGPALSGSAMDLIGPLGLPLSLAAMAGLFTAFLLLRRALARRA